MTDMVMQPAMKLFAAPVVSSPVTKDSQISQDASGAKSSVCFKAI
jgi:hypothetical protein